MTNPNISSHIDLAEESCYFGNQDSISSHNFELDQYPIFVKLTSYHFNKIEIEHECEPDLQFCDSVPNFESILSHVSLPDLDPVPKLTLIFLPMDHETEPSILDSHIPLLGNEYEIQFLIWTKLLNQLQFSNLNLIWVLFLSQYRSYSFHCWAQIIHSTKLYSIIGLKFRSIWLRDGTPRLVI